MIDASIPLAFNPQSQTGPDPNNLLKMLAAAQQYKAQQQQGEQQNALRNLFSNPQNVDKAGNLAPDVLRQAMAIDPAAGIKIRQAQAEQQQAEATLENSHSAAAIKRLDLMNEKNTEAINIYDAAMKAGVSEPEARARAQNFYSDTFKELSSNGLFTDDQLSKINPQFDPLRARANAQAMEQHLKVLQAQRADRAEAREGAAQAETTAHDKATEAPGARTPRANISDAPDENGKRPSQYQADVRARMAKGLSLDDAIVQQESNNTPQPVREVKTKNGPVEIGGRYQISKTIFDEYKHKGEKWGNQDDMDTVSKRALADYHKIYGDDPDRITTAWFSGRGNVAEPGAVQGTPKPIVPADDAYKQFLKEHPNATAAERQKFVEGGKATSPAAIAFQNFMATHPDATADEQAAFIRNTSSRSRSPEAMATQKFIEEHPNATSEEILANATHVRTAIATDKDFASGPESRRVNAGNTVIQHVQVARGYVDALKNGNIQLINRARQAWAEAFGSAAPTNIDQLSEFLGNEITTAVVATGGGQSEREAAGKAFSRVKSPEQLAGALDTAEYLLAGKVQSLRKQYEAGTLKHDFDERFLLPATREALAKHGYSEGGSEKKADAPELPPQARAALKKGQNTTFANGQVWTLGPDGNPKQVK